MPPTTRDLSKEWHFEAYSVSASHSSNVNTLSKVNMTGLVDRIVPSEMLDADAGEFWLKWLSGCQNRYAWLPNCAACRRSFANSSLSAKSSAFSPHFISICSDTAPDAKSSAAVRTDSHIGSPELSAGLLGSPRLLRLPGSIVTFISPVLSQSMLTYSPCLLPSGRRVALAWSSILLAALMHSCARRVHRIAPLASFAIIPSAILSLSFPCCSRSSFLCLPGPSRKARHHMNATGARGRQKRSSRNSSCSCAPSHAMGGDARFLALSCVV